MKGWEKDPKERIKKQKWRENILVLQFEKRKKRGTVHSEQFEGMQRKATF